MPRARREIVPPRSTRPMSCRPRYLRRDRGWRYASKCRNINGLGTVQPPGAGVEHNDAIVRADGATRREAPRRRQRGTALGSRVDARRGLKLSGGSDELIVRDRYSPTMAVAQGAQHEP